MGIRIRTRKNERAKPANLSANGLTVQVGDEVTWQHWMTHDLRTGNVVAATTTMAKVSTGVIEEVLPFSSLTVTRRARDDDKSAALVAVYKALHGLADAGDLTAFTFLANDWSELVPADLRALLDIGPDAEADGDQ